MKNEDYDVRTMRVQEWDKNAVLTKYGGCWCNCIDKIVDQINPEKLAAYCISKGYAQAHAPLRDELGIRYAYFLFTVSDTKLVSQNTEIETQRKIMAAFGNFDHRPAETLDGVLGAISRLSQFEKRPAQDIAEDVAEADESIVPEPKLAGGVAEMPLSNRRHMQGQFT